MSVSESSGTYPTAEEYNAAVKENARLKRALILMPMAERVAELPHFMAALSEWGCTDPNEQAAAITDFLNSNVGLRDYLDSAALARSEP